MSCQWPSHSETQLSWHHKTKKQIKLHLKLKRQCCAPSLQCGNLPLQSTLSSEHSLKETLPEGQWTSWKSICQKRLWDFVNGFFLLCCRLAAGTPWSTYCLPSAHMSALWTAWRLAAENFSKYFCWRANEQQALQHVWPCALDVASGLLQAAPQRHESTRER